MEGEGPQVVEPHDVIGVAVGVEHSIDATNAFTEGLGMEVRAGVDQDDAAVVGQPD